METDKITEKVEVARKATEHLDEPQKTEAFRIILNKLLDSDFKQEKSERKPKQKNKKTSQTTSVLTEVYEKRKEMASLINRTEYPKLHNLSKILDNSLYILLILKDKGYDGLTPSDIAYVLNEVFRAKANAAAISMALMKANEYVDRKEVLIKGAKAYVYRIMHQGEEYIKNILKGILETPEEEQENAE